MEREVKVSIPQLFSAISTMTVVTAELIKLIGQFYLQSVYSFDLKHCEDLLLSLEASHWHAYGFNENKSLRLNLINFGYLKQPLLQQPGQPAPSKRNSHLIEQEVLSIECILYLVYSLYSQENLSSYYEKAFKPDQEKNYANDSRSQRLAFAKYTHTEAEKFSKQWIQR
jgi:hypothetical protein